MNLKLIETKENVMLSRKECTFDLTYSGATPLREEIRKAISQSLKSKPELIVINKIKNDFGFQKALVFAKAYNSPSDLKRVEQNYILKRGSKKNEAVESEEKPKKQESKEEKKSDKKDTEKKE